MATQEKLLKTLEALKNLSKTNQQSLDDSKKKEKIQHCYMIAEAISNPTIKVATNFYVLLGTSVETLLKLSDDSDGDVRMTSEECLVRIIRSANDSHMGKIQIELHKEIKNNGAVRTLRTALALFSLLAHHIKAHKGKPYVVNLLPSLIKITERKEESLHETMATSLPKILKVLGSFCSENEIKVLLKAFLLNVSDQSAVLRRTTASSILSICVNCRKPYTFILYCLNNLLDLLIPVDDNQSNYLIMGVMNCIKNLLTSLNSSRCKQEQDKSSVKDSPTEKLLQVYELCLHYLTHKDHNVINACLETLNILLQNMTNELKEIILINNGIDSSKIHAVKISSSFLRRSLSQLSLATTVTGTDENLFLESELTETLHSDIEKWIDASKLSVINVTFAKTKEKSRSLDKVDLCLNAAVTDLYDFENTKKIDKNTQGDSLKTGSVGDKMDGFPLSENSSEKSLSCSGVDKLSNIENEIQVIDDGEYLDKNIPLLYCIRHITKLFLLNGNSEYISDKIVRVSTKSLALACISSIIAIFPEGFLIYLDKNYTEKQNNPDKKVSNQRIYDLFLFGNHPDPQLRGTLRVLVANFFKSIWLLSEGDYSKWIADNCGVQYLLVSPKNLVRFFIEGLEDESSNCIRQTLISLTDTLKYLIFTDNNYFILSLLNTLPLISKNPYWLVKVSLCELVSKINYLDVYYITKNSDFQNKVVYNILFKLIGDSDQRVRTAAATSIIEIVPLLYFKEYQLKESTVTSQAILLRDTSTKCLLNDEDEIDIQKKHFVKNMPFPLSHVLQNGCDKIDFSLSKIIIKIYEILLTATLKHLISGCIETLSLLSHSFPNVTYRNSWSISTKNNIERRIPDILSMCDCLLTNSVQVYDLQMHIKILNLTRNLYAGEALCLVRPQIGIEESKTLWNMFLDPAFSDLSEHYLSHVVKLLNIFYCILNEIVPIHPQSKAVLPSLPSTSSLSPIKRRKSDLDKKLLLHIKLDKEDKGEKKDNAKANSITSFVYSSHYFKIFDVLKSSFTNFKISLDSEVSQNFLDLLKETLNSLSILLEIGTLKELSRIAEDVLLYLRSTFIVDAPSTVQVVQQLLKCLFGTNLTANISEFSKDNSKEQETQDDQFGFYYNVFQKPYDSVSKLLLGLSSINFDCDSTIVGYLLKKDQKKRPVILSRSSDKTLANYIRIFEPMVIKSLKQYTITSNVKLQCQVLQLLSQLVQLRVNYCLLDSEQVFIGFVMKQFEYIEEGQVPYPNELIPKIFQFLVQLSYSKQHSKLIITIPKIIQLCDGLLASEQPPITHCIPALEPIVEDVFLTRNKNNSDIKELETTREVLLSMVLRLSEHRQVLKLLTLILEDSKHCTDNPEKWFEWSRQVVATILAMLKQNKILLDDTESFKALRQLILVLNPNVFKPYDEVIIMFFQEPPTDPILINRWLSKILVLLLIIVPLNEDILLNKINSLKSEFSPTSVFENAVTKADPLNVNNNAETFQKIPADVIFTRFLFRVSSLISKECLKNAKNEENTFLIEQFSIFLIHCLYIFQSGSHCKIANTAISCLNANIPSDENGAIQINYINKTFISLGNFYPILTFYWCYFLMLLNYNTKSFWLTVLKNDSESKTLINSEILKMGAFVTFSDYLGENAAELQNFSWFLTKNTRLLVKLCKEAPVFELISSIHRNSTTSKIFIENISSYFQNKSFPLVETNVLECIENCHSSQVGEVLKLLIPNMLNFRQVALSRMAANMASRKIEFLLTLPMEDVNSQLAKDHLLTMQKSLVALNLVKKHEALVSLLNKLSVQYYDLSPIEFDQRRVVNPEYIKRLQINKNWYISQIQARCKDICIGKETSELLYHLDYNEIMEYMSSGNFNKVCLQYCFSLGLKVIKENNFKDEPGILKASVDSLLKDVAFIVGNIPTPNQIFHDTKSYEVVLFDLKYTEELTHIFSNGEFINKLRNAANCVPYCVDSVKYFQNLNKWNENAENMMKFSVVCLEFISFLMKDEGGEAHTNLTDVFLVASKTILQNDQTYNILSNESYILWFSLAVNSIFDYITILLRSDKPLPSVPKYNLQEALENFETVPAGRACQQLYILVTWLYQIQNEIVGIPKFLLESIKSIVISLSRIPVVNSYVLIPTNVWENGWQPEMTGKFHTRVPTLPTNVLQEMCVLEEYIFRITLLGWTCRQEFEETWMCLLGVLCLPTADMDALEVNDVIHASSLANKAITKLLLQTLTTPTPGNPNISKLMHISRDALLDDDVIGIKKLKSVQDSILQKYKECMSIYKVPKILSVFEQENFEKSTNDFYCYGQISTKYFLIETGILSDSYDKVLSDVHRKRLKMLEKSGLDVNSCLQFLLDYFTQLMKPQSMTNIRILHETVRSTVIISDHFNDKSQFFWMLDVFLELSKTHIFEDELLHQYLIVGIAKAVGVLNPDLEVYEQVKKMLVQFLKSPYLSSRISCLHGLLYILEGCKLTNITIGGISDEMQLILPCAVEYVQANLNTTNSVLKTSEEHTQLVWSLAFYLIEHVDECNMEQNFVSSTLQTAFTMLNEKLTSPIGFKIIKRIERLIIVKKRKIIDKFGKQILKLAFDRLKSDNPTMAILGLQLLLSYMYTDCIEYMENTQVNSRTIPDYLVQTIEKISAIFERIKKGYAFEVEILCSILPRILEDFFLPSDILTKVIGEFLSSQQPHPKLMSKVVFQVFECAISQDQLPLLQDWVVFSLSNFTQSLSIGMATWCLTCFFISASSNKWLRSYFPYVQNRVGRYEYEDKKMLCIAGADFYQNLKTDKQMQTFTDNFKKVQDLPDMPFNDLLSSL